MAASIIDGRRLASEIRTTLRERTSHLAESGTIPHLKAVRVGDDAASGMFTRSQDRACRKEGILFSEEILPAGVNTGKVVECLERLNKDPQVSGIILVKPMGSDVDFACLRFTISPSKDVEGINSQTAVSSGTSVHRFHPCTAEAAMELALSTGFDFHGSHVVVVGGSETVGVPVALLALARWATITVCHIYTKDLANHTRQADCLFVAAGSPGLITADMVKPGAVVIDIGINRVEEKTPDGMSRTVTVGDVDFEPVSAVAGFLTPVPGGVGPMTVAVLLRNVVTAAEREFRSKG